MGNTVRRDDKETKDPEGIREILRKGLVCHLAMVDDGKPYMVAMNYGFRDDIIYLHAALEGRKIDILRKNPDICFMVYTGNRLTTGPEACEDWTMKYRSVTGFGKATLIEDDKEKIPPMHIIMDQYTTKGPFELSPKRVTQTMVISIDIEEMTGKISGY
ncbi:MAG: pyridoxamine 5'-phosphate oxidase family protein, partial [Bacteroidales bacterium]|nr:pyridoxamine 5'-phosphate oxidase family protein [Bacteroidales bacterium]